MREFDTGATRDTDEDKPGYAGYLSAQALQRFGEYMMKHQIQADGTKRASDNWKKGIPQDVYVDSLMRHVMDVLLWQEGAGELAREPVEDALCACLFNVQGLLHELVTERREQEPYGRSPVVDVTPPGYAVFEAVRQQMMDQRSVFAEAFGRPRQAELDAELDALEDRRAREVL